MQALTYLEFIKSCGWELIERFNSYEKAILCVYNRRKQFSAVELMILDNVHEWNLKWEVWRRNEI